MSRARIEFAARPYWPSQNEPAAHAFAPSGNCNPRHGRDKSRPPEQKTTAQKGSAERPPRKPAPIAPRKCTQLARALVPLICPRKNSHQALQLLAQAFRDRHKKSPPFRVGSCGDYLLFRFRSTIGVIRFNFSVRPNETR